MAGHIERFADGTAICLDYPDGRGKWPVNGRLYHFDFNDWGGPHFLRSDGDEMARQPYPGDHPESDGRGVTSKRWVAFQRWFKRWGRKFPRLGDSIGAGRRLRPDLRPTLVTADHALFVIGMELWVCGEGDTEPYRRTAYAFNGRYVIYAPEERTKDEIGADLRCCYSTLAAAKTKGAHHAP